MHVGRASIAHDVKLNKCPMRRLDARINFIRQPVLLYLALHSVHIPAVLAAEVGVLETESAFVIAGRHRTIRSTHRPAFTVGHSSLGRWDGTRRRLRVRLLYRLFDVRRWLNFSLDRNCV